MITEHYERLSRREQIIVLLGSVTLFFFFAYFLWSSIVGKNSQLKENLVVKQNTLQWINTSSKAIQSKAHNTNQSPQSNDNRTLESRIAFIAKKHGIDITLSSQRKNAVKFEVKNISFTKLHQSLFEMESKWGIQIDAANISQIKDKAGRVNARFTVKK